jgi:hypothetical protein
LAPPRAPKRGPVAAGVLGTAALTSPDAFLSGNDGEPKDGLAGAALLDVNGEDEDDDEDDDEGEPDEPLLNGLGLGALLPVDELEYGEAD